MGAFWHFTVAPEQIIATIIPVCRPARIHSQLYLKINFRTQTLSWNQFYPYTTDTSSLHVRRYIPQPRPPYPQISMRRLPEGRQVGTGSLFNTTPVDLSNSFSSFNSNSSSPLIINSPLHPLHTSTPNLPNRTRQTIRPTAFSRPLRIVNINFQSCKNKLQELPTYRTLS